MLQSKGSQRVGHDLVTAEQQQGCWTRSERTRGEAISYKGRIKQGTPNPTASLPSEFSCRLVNSHSSCEDWMPLFPSSLREYLCATRLLCPWSSPARILEWVSVFLQQGIFPTQGLNLGLLCLPHCRQILYPPSHQGSPLKCLCNVYCVPPRF